VAAVNWSFVGSSTLGAGVMLSSSFNITISLLSETGMGSEEGSICCYSMLTPAMIEAYC
jgi:hypothetical protein